jgi:hypothetical protein
VTSRALSPADAPARLCELSADARACVLLDERGRVSGASDPDPERAEELGRVAAELVAAVDLAAPDGPPEQAEAQVGGGTVFTARRGRWTLVTVARRSALSALMHYDAREVLAELEGRPPVNRVWPPGEGGGQV